MSKQTQGLHLGIYGGSFDPPHASHVALAQAALSQCKLDRLHVIPTGDAVHKRRRLTAAYHRLAMTRLAFAQLEKTVVDPREIDRGAASYTIDTVTELATQYPGARLTLVIGYDQLLAFPTWRDYARILEQVQLVVALRGGVQPSCVGLAYEPLLWPVQAMSSSDIRQKLRLKIPLNAATMHPAVAAYIETHRLYLDEWMNP